MLNKNICKSCFVVFGSPKNAFGRDDELLWGEGFVFCPFCRRSHVDRDPSDYCPYRMEHIVLSESE